MPSESGSSEVDFKVDKRQDGVKLNKNGKVDHKWYDFLASSDPPHPPPVTPPQIPDVGASIFSRWTYNWITPLMALGYARPLVPEDLYALDAERQSTVLADRFEAAFERRVQKAKEYNERLAKGEIQASVWKRARWTFVSAAEREKRLEAFRSGEEAKAIPSLLWALNDVLGRRFWMGSFWKVISDTAQTTSPLLTKAIIQYATRAYFAPPGAGPGIGEGIGYAIGLLCLLEISSLGSQRFFYNCAGTGVLVRSILITSIYRQAVRLTGRSRATHTNGKLTSHISTDVSRIDFAATFFHQSWTAPIQMAITLALLITNIGASALVGFALFVVLSPLQIYVMKALFGLRKKSMPWTDARVSLIGELLGGMRVLKYFAQENPYLQRLGEFRTNELESIRKLLLYKSANNAIAFSLPAVASALAFAVYLNNREVDPATIFTSLSLFIILRLPLAFLPISLATISDGKSAFQRLTPIYLAEQRDPNMATLQVQDASYGVQIQNAHFEWEAPPPVIEDPNKAKKASAKKAAEELASRKRAAKSDRSTKKSTGFQQSLRLRNVQKEPQMTQNVSKDPAIVVGTELPLAPASGEKADLANVEKTTADEDRDLFEMTDLNLNIKQGSLTAVVGAVGSGKSSLLQGIVGEMRKVSGQVMFSGSVGYAPQMAWIQNASVRENILFGQPMDEERYLETLRDACLEDDLRQFPHGDNSQIGEKGINLSGGQRQRVNIARLIYANKDIVLLDDCLSAVDAHVGKYLFENAIKGALGKKTRILVTHALHFLPETDFIITLVDGKVAEQGTYEELMSRKGAFYQLITDFGSQKEENEEEPKAASDLLRVEAENKASEDVNNSRLGDAKERLRQVVEGSNAKDLIVEEHRAVGALSGSVYKQYLTAANGWIIGPLLLLAIILTQGSSVLNSYWIIWWQKNQFSQPNGFYIGIYAGLALSQTVSLFLLGATFSAIAYAASKTIFQDAIGRVFHAPMSFLDTTPLGRITNRFAKDIDVLDNTLNDAVRMMLTTLSSIIGAVILIAIVEAYFLIAVAVLSVLYIYAAFYYRASSRELKRLDAVLRSNLYSHFGESLAGLATIRAYQEMPRFMKENEQFMDVENRAYYLTIVNQRWLGVRLDLLGSLLTFTVALISVIGRKSISPSQIGLILSYMIQVQGSFGWMVRQAAEVENDMNSVERLLEYANHLEQERPELIPETQPAASWPQPGVIEFKNVVMSYREGLPPVLKGLSFACKAGEKIGIVGRTGAGKSSMMTALFRLVELSSGSITIDGIDIATLGLRTLREKLAILPQDPLLFNGTMRTNLDPFLVKDDITLWDALKRSYVVDRDQEAYKGASRSGIATPVSRAISPGPDSTVGSESGNVKTRAQTSRFTLDTVIDDEGSNLSVGERSLVSLARALVRDSKIIVLDEATASVDFETDSLLQATIRTEFKDKTLLCIAHRLKTIIGYDRVMVMSAGAIEEFAAPLELFDREKGAFRAMCDRSGISRADIVLAAREIEIL